jgi:hypothetical protein
LGLKLLLFTKRGLCLVIVWCAPGSLWAGDYSGTCAGTVPLAGSPHSLVGTCSVPVGETFDFEPGAELVRISGALTIFGTMNSDQAILTGLTVTVASGGVFESNQGTLISTSIAFGGGSSGAVTSSEVSGGTCAIQVTDSSPTISDNTFLDVQSAVCVGGTSIGSPASPTISGNVITARSRGVDFTTGTARGVVSGNTIGFLGTTSSRVGIELEGAVSPTVTGNTIRDDPDRSDIGISVAVSEASTVVVELNDICSTGGDQPLLVGAGVFALSSGATIQNNVFSCGAGSGLGLTGAFASESSVGSIESQSVYNLPAGFFSTVSVLPGVAVTLVPGTLVRGDGGSRLEVRGTLTASQAELSRLRLDVVAGGAVHAAAASMDDVTVTVSGHLAFDEGTISASNGSITFNPGGTGSITGSSVTDTSGCAIQVTDSSPTISENVFPDVSSAVCVGGTSIGTPAAPTVSGNVITTRSRGVDYTAGTAGGVVSGNTIGFLGTVSNRIGVELEGAVSPTVTGNTIQDDPDRSDIGISIAVSEASTMVVELNDICSTGGDQPLSLGAGVFALASGATIQNNVFSCGAGSGLGLTGTFASESSVGSIESQSVYNLPAGASTVAVSPGVAVTLAPGALVRGDGNSRLEVRGTLTASQAGLSRLRLDVVAGGAVHATAATMDDVTVTVSGHLAFDEGTISASNGSMTFNPGGTGSITSSSVTDTSGCAIQVTDSSPTISDNVFPDVSSAVCVGGTSIGSPAAPTISGNVITTRSRGVDYTAGTAGGVVSGNTIGFLGTVSNRIGVELEGAVSPTVTGNTILDDPNRDDIGISVGVTGASTVQVVNNDICATAGDQPLRLGGGVFSVGAGAVVENNVFSCGTGSGFALIGTFDTDSVLGVVEGQSSLSLSSFQTVTVSAGVEVTIPAGFELRGQGSPSRIQVNGTLVATQAPLSRLTISVITGGSFDATEVELSDVTVQVASGGAFVIDGSSYAGGLVQFEAGSTGSVTNSTFTGSGGRIFITSASPVISGNLFAGLAPALQLNGTTDVSITGNTFAVTSGAAIQFNGPEARSTVSGNTFQRTTWSLQPGTAEALYSAFPVDFSANTFVGSSTENLVWLPFSLNLSGTFPVSPVAYVNNFNQVITNNAQVILPPGTVVMTGTNGTLTVSPGSRLVAIGTPERPIVFTDFDPTDTTRWRGLIIQDDTSLLENCVIEFSAFDGLRLEGASIPVTNCRISDNQGDGIEITGDAAPTITGSSIVLNLGDGVKVNTSAAPSSPIDFDQSSIFSNGLLGINNLRTDFDVGAMHNYWGDDTGPFDGSDDRATGGLFNALGAGEQVSDHVLYDPWIRIGPSQEGVILPFSGLNQTGTAGSTLPEPIVVEIRSLLDTPLEGVEVIFSVVKGDASIVEAQPIVTDANGRAAATVQLGLEVGEVVLAVTARDVNSPLATFMAEADAPCLMSFQVTPFEIVVRPGVVGQPGDVNGDGDVTHADAALIQAVLERVLTEASAQIRTWQGADVNRDGRVDAGDVLLIQGIQVGSVGRREVQ